jgi:hypothetical protein
MVLSRRDRRGSMWWWVFVSGCANGQVVDGKERLTRKHVCVCVCMYVKPDHFLSGWGAKSVSVLAGISHRVATLKLIWGHNSTSRWCW